MNKKFLIVLFLGVLGTLIVVGVTRFLPVSKQEAACATEDSTPAAATASPVQDVTSADQLTAALDGTRPFVVKFYANWCGACSYVNSYYGDLGQAIPEVDFYSVNIDNQELMKSIDTMKLSKEGIEYLPTFIMIYPGKIQEQITGAKKKEDMIETIKKTLNV